MAHDARTAVRHHSPLVPVGLSQPQRRRTTDAGRHAGRDQAQPGLPRRLCRRAFQCDRQRAGAQGRRRGCPAARRTVAPMRRGRGARGAAP